MNNNNGIISFLLLICIFYNTISSKQDYTTYFVEYHFDWDNGEYWHTIPTHNTTKNAKEITACTDQIKELKTNICIHTKSEGGFTLTIENMKLDFVNNNHWSEINAISNWSTQPKDRQHRRLHIMNNNYNIYDLHDMYNLYSHYLPGGVGLCALICMRGGSNSGDIEPDWRDGYYSEWRGDNRRYKGNNFGRRGGYGGRGHIPGMRPRKFQKGYNDPMINPMLHPMLSPIANGMVKPMYNTLQQMMMMKMMSAHNAMDNNYYYYNNGMYNRRRLRGDYMNKGHGIHLGMPGNNTIINNVSMDRFVIVQKCLHLNNETKICVMYNPIINRLNVYVKCKQYIVTQLKTDKKELFPKTLSKLIKTELIGNGKYYNNEYSDYAYYFNTFEFNWHTNNNWNDTYNISVLPLIQFGNNDVLSVDMGQKCGHKLPFVNFKLCSNVSNKDITVFFEKMDAHIDNDVDIGNEFKVLENIMNYEFENSLFSFNNDNDWHEIITSYPDNINENTFGDNDKASEIQLFGHLYVLKGVEFGIYSIESMQPIQLSKTTQLPITKMCHFMYIAKVCLELNPNVMELKLAVQFQSAHKWEKQT